MQFSFCSRSSRTGVGFPFFHICLFLRLNQPVFVYSLVRDTDISFQILKKALYLFHLFPKSPDFVVTPPFLHCSKATSTLCGPFRIPSLPPDISQGQCCSCQLLLPLHTPKPDPFHSHLYPAFSLSRCLLRISRPASRRRSLICRAESLIHRRRVTGRAHRSINFLYHH